MVLPLVDPDGDIAYNILPGMTGTTR